MMHFISFFKGSVALEYRGFKIEVEKLDGDNGYSMSACRISDNWILGDSWNPTIKTTKEAIEEIKITIDDYYEYPEYYED